MSNKQLTEIKYHLCEYILQRYGIELHGEPEIEELAKKIQTHGFRKTGTFLLN